MKLRLEKIHEAAAARPPGYLADVLAQGEIVDEFLQISAAALAQLREKYRPPPPSRSRPPEPPLPPLLQRAWNLAAQAVAEVASIATSAPRTMTSVAEQRLRICRENPCGHWRKSDESCALCGCPMERKSPLRSARCPVGKW